MTNRTYLGGRGGKPLHVGDLYPPPDGIIYFEIPEATCTGWSLVTIPYISARGLMREYRYYSQTARSVQRLKLLAYASLTRHNPNDPATQQAAKIALRFCEICLLRSHGTYSLCVKQGQVLSHNTIKPILLRKTHKKTNNAK